MAPSEEDVDPALRDLRAQELRRANDGQLYSAAEFEAHYGDDWHKMWERADRCVSAGSPPQGLSLGYVGDLELLLRAREEIEPLLSRTEVQGEEGASWAPQVLEMGMSFYNSDYSNDGTWRVEAKEARPLAEFPALKKVLTLAMGSITPGAKPGADMLDSPLLNVIVRRYCVGDGIVFHRDKVDWFQEEVFGVVLRNTSDRSLEFHRSDGAGDSISRWLLDEVPGACFQQRGEARFDWSHGVRPIGTGERISATWRWFQPVQT